MKHMSKHLKGQSGSYVCLSVPFNEINEEKNVFFRALSKLARPPSPPFEQPVELFFLRRQAMFCEYDGIKYR